LEARRKRVKERGEERWERWGERERWGRRREREREREKEKKKD
jgi:hypothetical protein